jgi:DnaJ family protein C protein 9
MSNSPTLYELLGVQPTATDAEIKKAYRQRALQTHPDKQLQENAATAAAAFAEVHRAYEILSDSERRKIYDERGEEQSAEFQSAYEFFRSFFPRVKPEDIGVYAKTYKHSEQEKNDLREFFVKSNGNMEKLLQSVILADSTDIDRFVAFFREEINEGRLGHQEMFEMSIKKLKKSGAKVVKTKPKESTDDLAELILRKRKSTQDNIIDELEAKYAKKPRKSRA